MTLAINLATPATSTAYSVEADSYLFSLFIATALIPLLPSTLTDSLLTPIALTLVDLNVLVSCAVRISSSTKLRNSTRRRNLLSCLIHLTLSKSWRHVPRVTASQPSDDEILR